MKTSVIRLPFFIILFLILSLCKPEREQGIVYNVDLNSLSSEYHSCNMSTRHYFEKDVLIFKPTIEQPGILIFNSERKADWEKAKFLVCDVYHENNYSAILYFDFYRKDSQKEQGKIVQQGGQSTDDRLERPRISAKIGVLPGLKTRVIFPLSYLDGQEIFLDRQPRQLKGTVSGRRLDISDIGKVILRLEPLQSPDFAPNLEIGNLFLSSSEPQPLEDLIEPIVDEFGQWKFRDWKGKIKNEAELERKMHQLDSSASKATFPDQWSRYGGLKSKKFKSTGFFRTEYDGLRWWFVDPEGYAFLSTGIDCIRDGSTGVLSGQEDIFEWMPSKDDTIYGDIFSERRNIKMVDFIKANLIKVYGEQWRNAWEKISVGMMKHYAINTIGNWSDTEFARKAKIPYVYNMSGFPDTRIRLYRDFPDVFSEEYGEKAIDYASQLQSLKDDPYMIGYFLRNEPHWAFGDNNLAFEMLATNTPSATRKEFIHWLSKKYSNISGFNTAWKLNLKSFDELNSLTLKDSPSEECWLDCQVFSGIMVDQYVKKVCDEVKKVDPNHLNLGLRYAWISSELCYRAGAYFDVFSINGYSYPGPPETAQIHERSGKPVMIGEFHFGATDRGLPATGIQGAASQQARGEAYRYYLEQGFSRPEVIGLHYFQWYDQPVFGRYDGENYNIGFFDIALQPYDELVNSARESHLRMYEVATGEKKPFNNVIDPYPQIFY